MGTVTGMSPENQSRRARRTDAQHNRRALLAAAKRLFAQRGPDVPLDEIAKTAKVGNATLYRHFATRAELLVAVYADEVVELHRLGERLTEDTDPDRALTTWLRAFVRHVAAKRDLALAIPDEPDGQRGVLFTEWHNTMHDAAAALLTRARVAGVARDSVHVADLLVVVAGIALTGVPEARLDALLDLVRDGYRCP